MTDEGMTDRGGCESCGEANVPLTTVQRVYVVPESWENEASAEVAENEQWCATCVAHYPHIQAEA